MAIPVALQSFKAAGIYRMIFDKSTVLNEDTNILRLVVGYSEKGPFNTPVYVSSVSEFKSIFGDGSKKLEKRGVYFHRLAKQCLQKYPILALNLKKFANEKVSGITVSTLGYNADGEPLLDQIKPIDFYVNDIYDTTRFWMLDANRLHEIESVNEDGSYNKGGKNKTDYITISSVGAEKDSHTVFIRKAAGSKVASYNVSVSDWYKDGSEDIPEFLQNKLDSQISDYFAEIYVFRGEFTKKQIIASETLQNYFDLSTDENGKDVIKLKPFIYNAYGERVDTLDALYNDSSAGAYNHYVGCLIPYFKNKVGSYAELSVLFNQDVDFHNMMMSFNTDLLEETDDHEPISIDLSFSNNIKDAKTTYKAQVSSILGNINSPVNIVTYSVGTDPRTNEPIIVATDSYVDEVYGASFSEIPVGDATPEKVTAPKYDGMYSLKLDATIASIVNVRDRFIPADERADSFPSVYSIVDINTAEDEYGVKVDSSLTGGADTSSKWSVEKTDVYKYAGKLTDGYAVKAGQSIADPMSAYSAKKEGKFQYESSLAGSSLFYCAAGFPDVMKSDIEAKKDSSTEFKIKATGYKSTSDSTCISVGKYNSLDTSAKGKYSKSDVYYKDTTAVSAGTLVTDAEKTALKSHFASDDATGSKAFTQPTLYYTKQISAGEFVDTEKYNKLGTDAKGKCSQDVFYENTIPSKESHVLFAILDGNPDVAGQKLVRVENSCNQEIGDLMPYCLKGYVYENDKPVDTSMTAKQNWQDFQLSALTEYRGIRTALLNKSEIDYRYIVDTFESFVDFEIKSVLSMLAKEKDSAFLIANFPSVKTFLKCPFNSYTDERGNFNVQYVVDGYNKKKAHTKKFCLPSEPNGASYCAFYTPLKFSDGYIDDICPSAGIVSNLFIDKYYSRHPYDIIAGPNYGGITVTGLTGPDYNYSKEELNIIEPFGVNCMVYRPSFGTFINANQTAKQTPKSALSSVNVRELCIYIQDEIEKLLQSYQWEFNNATVRQKIKDKADSICQSVKNTGGIMDFLNIMDESNNTPEIIDNEMSVLSTHIEPGRGMGKMVQQLTLYRTGQMKVAISE